MFINEKTYVDEAERVIKALKVRKNEKTGKNIPRITTSKIRNLLSMTADIYNEVLNGQEETLNDELCGRIDYLKVRFLYEAGRELSVKAFVEEAQIIRCLKEIQGSKKNFILFNRYMEALVAYHRFYGGQD